MPAPMEFLALCLRQTMPNPLPTTVAGRFLHATTFLRCLILRFGPFLVADTRFCAALIGRIERMNARLAVLAAKFAAGTLPPPSAEPTPHATKPTTTRQTAPTDRLPTRFAWLLSWIQVTVHPRTIIENLLEDPDLHALIAAAPQTGRILRPLCHMLGIPRPEILATPQRPRKPRQSPRPRIEPQAPPATPEPPPMPAWHTQMHARPTPPRPFRLQPELTRLWGRQPKTA